MKMKRVALWQRQSGDYDFLWSQYGTKPLILNIGCDTWLPTSHDLSAHLILTMVDIDVILVWLRSAYLDGDHFVVVTVPIVDYPNYLVQSMANKNLLNNKNTLAINMQQQQAYRLLKI